jgi:hypothetical protein
MLALLAACGPSASQITRARSVTYQADFALVWNAVVQAVGEDYKDIKFEDATKGVLQTDWTRVERGNEEVEQEQDPNAQRSQEEAEREVREAGQPGNPHARGRIAFKLIRVRVEVQKGGPPWRVTVSAEAARYEPGMTMLIPYQRGAIDEPVWVEPRIDRLYVAIYERLKKYAIDVTPAPRQPSPGVAKRTSEAGPWAGLPGEARDVVAAVQAAARKKDPAGIRPHMIDPFVSSVGAVPADQTVAVWSADPTELDVLAAALDRGCDLDAAAERITCPRGAAGGLRAVFHKTAGVWKLAQLAE